MSDDIMRRRITVNHDDLMRKLEADARRAVSAPRVPEETPE